VALSHRSPRPQALTEAHVRAWDGSSGSRLACSTCPVTGSVVPAGAAGRGIAFPAPGEHRWPAPAVTADRRRAPVPAAGRSRATHHHVRGRFRDRPVPGVRSRAHRARREPALSGDPHAGGVRRALSLGRGGGAGRLELSVAFSRADAAIGFDGRRHVVQTGQRRPVDDIIRAEADALWELLRSTDDGGRGAFVYVCGSARFATSVRQALTDIVPGGGRGVGLLPAPRRADPRPRHHRRRCGRGDNPGRPGPARPRRSTTSSRLTPDREPGSAALPGDGAAADLCQMCCGPRRARQAPDPPQSIISDDARWAVLTDRGGAIAPARAAPKRCRRPARAGHGA
jgi:hypothetical protein